MGLTSEGLQQLLFEAESQTLDFKREQYRFRNADDAQKSELLKDILAFANSFRRTSAYILVGVNETKTGKAEVVGIEDHLDDAELQQFVNSKTQRPVEFSYRNVKLEGKTVGIIEIPMQQRPLYLKKKYGKIAPEKVLLRRGSSTDTASLDEIAKMGQNAPSLERESLPELRIQFADPSKNKAIGSILSLRTTVLNIPPVSQIADYSREGSSGSDFYRGDPMHRENEDYWRELAVFWKEQKFFRPIKIRLENIGSVDLMDASLVLSCPESMTFIEESDLRVKPRPSWSLLSQPLPFISNPLFNDRIKASVSTNDGSHVATYQIKRLRPKERVFTEGDLFVGATKSGSFALDYEVLASNLPDPITGSLNLSFEVAFKKLGVEGIYNLPLPP